MSNLFPYFPVFLDLAGRSVILLGADEEEASLARLLLASGASVAAFDPSPCDAMRALAPPVRLKLRRWRGDDFKGARLVIASSAEPRAQRAMAAAHAVGATFHLLGAPDQSDIALGGVAGRGAFAVGVAAQGAPPALAEALRAQVEAALPPGLPEFLEAASRARGAVDARIADPAKRAAFWRALGMEAFALTLETAEEWDALIAARLDGVAH